STVSSVCSPSPWRIWHYLSGDSGLVGSRHDSCRPYTCRQSNKSSGMDGLQVFQPVPGYRVSRDGPGREASSTLSSNIDKSEFHGESQKVLDDGASMGMLLIRPFWMELETVDWTCLMAYGLNL